jgi:hypothetical protein
MKDFDLAALSEAMDARRRELGMTWQELAIQVTDRPSRGSGRRIAASTCSARRRRTVAGEIGPGFSPGMLTRLAGGTGIGFPRVMRIFQWLGRPVAEFICFVPDVDD